jgi:hypothetical protein
LAPHTPKRDFVDDGLTLGGIVLAGAGLFLLAPPLLLVFLGLLMLLVGVHRSR